MTPPAETDKRQLQGVHSTQESRPVGALELSQGPWGRGIYVQALIRLMGQNLGGVEDRYGPLVRVCIGANHPGRTKIRCRHSSMSPQSLRDHPVDGSIQPRFGTTSILIDLGSRMSMSKFFFLQLL
jgi:hypothetical protein